MKTDRTTLNNPANPIIGVQAIFTVILTLAITLTINSCAPAKPDAQTRGATLAASKGADAFKQPPSEGEMVIGTYEATYYNQHSGLVSNKYESLEFSGYAFDPGIAASFLILKAKEQFPELDIEELDVRSLTFLGASVTQGVNEKFSVVYQANAKEWYKFQGTVVKLPQNMELQAGVYKWSNKWIHPNESMTVSLEPSAGTISATLNNSPLFSGTYKIKGNHLIYTVTQMAITAGHSHYPTLYNRYLLLGKNPSEPGCKAVGTGLTYVYAITGNSSFSGYEEVWEKE